MSSVRNGVLIALASSNATMLISFIASLFLARLLTPHEIGIFSIAYVFASLLRTVREMGLGAYIVQETELTDERLRTAFGISVVLSVITGTLVAMLAGVAGDFYREQGVTRSILVIALSFFLVPFGATTMSVLRRGMRFKDIAIIDTISTLVQSGSAVLLAWLGFSYMSLAWSSLIGIAATVISTFYYRPSTMPWMPSLREWRRVMSFGAYASGSSLLNFASNSASDLVLGRMLNVESVALFNRANGFSELLSGVIGRAMNTVGLPYFSQQHRNGAPQAPAFIDTSTMIAMLSTPVYAVLAILAEPTILFLFGPQWTQSIVVLQILCVAAIMRGPALLSNQVMTAAGAVRPQLKLDLQGLLFKLAAVIGCASLGLQAVAWGYCASSVITTILRLQALNRLIDTNWRALWPIAKHSLLTGTFSVIGPALIMMTDTHYPTYLTLVLAGLTATAGWTAAVLLTSNPLKHNLLQALAQMHHTKGSN